VGFNLQDCLKNRGEPTMTYTFLLDSSAQPLLDVFSILLKDKN
jgi:hypothetical protein